MHVSHAGIIKWKRRIIQSNFWRRLNILLFLQSSSGPVYLCLNGSTIVGQNLHNDWGSLFLGYAHLHRNDLCPLVKCHNCNVSDEWKVFFVADTCLSSFLVNTLLSVHLGSSGNLVKNPCVWWWFHLQVSYPSSKVLLWKWSTLKELKGYLN